MPGSQMGSLTLKKKRHHIPFYTKFGNLLIIVPNKLGPRDLCWFGQRCCRLQVAYYTKLQYKINLKKKGKRVIINAKCTNYHISRIFRFLYLHMYGNSGNFEKLQVKKIVEISNFKIIYISRRYKRYIPACMYVWMFVCKQTSVSVRLPVCLS